ncbi:hypothetical protein C1632_05550 [Microbacterium testaceum]|uniref:hypothetical protein n=1 Tax=Microbacterium testaceum TaxID=2033 RepID=UPI000CCF5A3F|nr:hypothetical protein [Microbacterium testaceum]PNW09863.1 hypothetical protein C1632_05550 [Microbacterium testaceum]
MSGPYDRADDPEEVTLWAGRLRAWPTPPAAGDDEIVDETILSRREAPEDETARGAADVPADETVISRRSAPDDDTVRSRTDVPVDETVISRRSAPDDDTVRSRTDVPADETVISRRSAPDDDTVRSRTDVPADETVISRRSAPDDDTIRSHVAAPDDAIVISSDGAPDDATIVSQPAPRAAPEAIGSVDDEVGTTAPRGVAASLPVASPAAPAPGLDEATRRPPHGGAGAADLDDVTRRRSSAEPGIDGATRARAVPQVDDDTASGSRRRRREAASAASDSLVEGAVRDARVPAALARQSYGPRREGPVRVERAPAVRVPSSGDAAAVRPRARGGAARVVVLASVIVVVLVASVIGAALLLTG